MTFGNLPLRKDTQQDASLVATRRRCATPFRTSRKTPLALVLLLGLSLCLAATALASARGDGWKMHKAGRNAEAVPLLQQAVQEDPNDAKAYWFLAQVYDDMGQGSEGIAALQNARRLDPSLSFAGSANSVQSIEQSLTRKMGSSGASNGGTGSSGVGSSGSSNGSSRALGTTAGGGELDDQKAILVALKQNGVYVSPAMQNVADPAQIAQKVREVKPRFVTNVLVVKAKPRQFRSISQWATSLHKTLDLGSGLVVVATASDVGADGGNLSQADLQKLVQSAAKTFTAEGYPAGIAQVVRLANDGVVHHQATNRLTILMIITIPAGLILFFVSRRKKQSAQEMGQVQGEANELSAQLAPSFEKLDSDFEYALLAEKDPARKAMLQERRQQVGQMFSDSMKRLRAATTSNDFMAARNGLQMTQAEIQRAHNILQGKPENQGVQNLPSANSNSSLPSAMPNAGGQNGFTGHSSNVEEIPPIGANFPGAQQGYALDFFTSQPVPTNQMVPVELEVNGQRRRVWASPQSAQSALAGNPQIATMNYQGQQRPWFDVPQTQYNPWHDFGSSMMQMMAFNMMWDAMTDRHSYYHHGWGGGGWGGGGWGGNTYNNYNYNDYDRGGYANRDDGYDNRMHDATNSAGQASINSPLTGGWDNTPDTGGGASLDVFGGGGVSGGGSS